MNQAINVHNPSLLVIGYGHLTHGDDAIGCQVTNQIQALGLDHVETFTVEQLTPELSATLATADYAIFVDACKMEAPSVRVSPLNACGMETSGSSVPGQGHSCHPCSLLALTQSVYGRHPQAWWVEISAQDFVSGHPISRQANQSVQSAMEAIQSLIKECLVESTNSRP